MQTLGPYELLRELGRGGTATVYLAKHRDTGKTFAVKVFHPGLIHRERVAREITLSSSLRHENIVPVVETLWTEEPALVMEYVDGQTLEEFQARLPYVLPELSVAIVIAAARAVEHAHRQGIIHRDLKPENILISKSGLVLVTDFGLARLQDAATITQDQAILGTLDYLSPEQAEGSRVTPLSDLFSLGTILYFLTTGTRPFARSSGVATITAVREEAPDPPQRRNPKLPAALSRIILKAMAKIPAERFASVTEFRENLERYLESVGLAQDVLSLEKWLESPSACTFAALETSATFLEVRCQSALGRGETSRVLEDLAHLSLKAPESPALKRMSSELARQRPWSPRTAGAFGIGIVFLVGIAWWALSRSAAQVPKSAVAVPSPANAIDEVKSERPRLKTAPPPPALSPPDTEAPAVAYPTRRTSRPAEPAPKPMLSTTGTVRFRVPGDAEVFWDYKPVDPIHPLINQKAGPHQVIVNRPGYELIRVAIQVEPGEVTEVNIHE